MRDYESVGKTRGSISQGPQADGEIAEVPGPDAERETGRQNKVLRRPGKQEDMGLLMAGVGAGNKPGLLPVETSAKPQPEIKKEKMGRMVEVKKCLECPYQRGESGCDNPELWKRIKIGEVASKWKIDNLDTIPDWCPLPEKGEEDGE